MGSRAAVFLRDAGYTTVTQCGTDITCDEAIAVSRDRWCASAEDVRQLLGVAGAHKQLFYFARGYAADAVAISDDLRATGGRLVHLFGWGKGGTIVPFNRCSRLLLRMVELTSYPERRCRRCGDAGHNLRTCVIGVL